MPMLEIDLDSSLIERLHQAAQHLNLTPAELVKLSLEAKLAEVEQDFQQAAEYVLAKNTELYRRLA